MEDGNSLRKIQLYSSLRPLELTKFVCSPTLRLLLTSRMRKVSNSSNKKINKEMTNITEMFPKSLFASQKLDLRKLFSSTLLSLKDLRLLVLVLPQVMKRLKKVDLMSSHPTLIVVQRWRLFPKSYMKLSTDF